MFRQVELPRGVRGSLFLHHLPGTVESFSQFEEAVHRQGIQRVICLTLLDEVRFGAPEYGRLIDSKTTPWQQVNFPIRDYSVPDDRTAFLDLAREIARELVFGEKVLIHCYGGKGRSGMLAEVVLMALGLSAEQAETRVLAAGGHTERSVQRDLVKWAARQLH